MSEVSKNELERLIYALCDDSITDEEHELLQQTLTKYPEARLHYIKQMEIHNLLDLECEDFVAKPNVVPIDKYLAKQRRKTAINACAAAAVVIIGIAVSLHMMTVTSEPALSTVKAAPHSKFEISHTSDHQASSDKNYLTSGSSLELHQGTVEVNLSSGVNAVVQAPAKLTLDDDSNLDLLYGVAWFNVPSEAVGFEVTTPEMTIVDLGTEFGVSVDYRSIEADMVHVLKGSVEVTTNFGLESHEVLTIGDARRAHFSGRLTKIPVSEDSYLKALPTDLPYLHWSFDEQLANGFTTRGTVPLASNIQAEARNASLDTDTGKVGQAVVLKGIGGVVTDWQGIDSDQPRTVSCWIKCPPHQPVGAIVGWGVPNEDASKWRITLNPEKQNEGGVKGALRTEFGYGYIIGTTDLRDGKWHHITSVYDGSGVGNESTIKLYVDGEPEEVSAVVGNYIDTLVNDPRSAPCAIGSGFKGKIDELRIYKGVLPARAIREAYNAQGND